jgi:hypothetical protein
MLMSTIVRKTIVDSCACDQSGNHPEFPILDVMVLSQSKLYAVMHSSWPWSRIYNIEHGGFLQIKNAANRENDWNKKRKAMVNLQLWQSYFVDDSAPDCDLYSSLNPPFPVYFFSNQNWDPVSWIQFQL